MIEISNLKNILVYRIGHLGDTIVALPAFWEIRNKFPNAQITLLTNSDEKNKNYVMAKSILPEKVLFDDLISYDNSAGSFEKLSTFTKLYFKLRSKKFDGLFYLSTRIRTIAQIERDVRFFRLAGIKNIFGTDYLKEHRLDFQQTRPLPEVEAEFEFLLSCLPFDINIEQSKLNHKLFITESEKNVAREWLQKKCGDKFENNIFIAVAPGSKWESKKWFERRFEEVLTRLIEEYSVVPIIFGGREDFETGEKILSQIPNGVNAAGELNIREACAALEFCDLYLGNDTGTMHMAATVGIPCVALFAAIDFKGRWYPFGQNNRIFRYTVECEGCHTPNCYNQNECLKLISSDEVFSACCEILDK